MKIKLEHNLMPSVYSAHSVTVVDDLGNPLFAALHYADGIVCAAFGDKDFETVLRLVGAEARAPEVIEVKK
ncbi:MAG: hypothetical protein EBY76_07400 [Betaproteobacteria bacterium]|nr:hypothetical protein [Betaproteobacteria bacterium]